MNSSAWIGTTWTRSSSWDTSAPGRVKFIGQFGLVDVNDGLRRVLLRRQSLQGLREPVLRSVAGRVIIGCHRGRSPLVCICVDGGSLPTRQYWLPLRGPSPAGRLCRVLAVRGRELAERGCYGSDGRVFRPGVACPRVGVEVGYL